MQVLLVDTHPCGHTRGFILARKTSNVIFVDLLSQRRPIWKIIQEFIQVRNPIVAIRAVCNFPSRHIWKTTRGYTPENDLMSVKFVINRSPGIRLCGTTEGFIQERNLTGNYKVIYLQHRDNYETLLSEKRIECVFVFMRNITRSSMQMRSERP